MNQDMETNAILQDSSSPAKQAVNQSYLPLVSIIVITCNSAQYVQETLESAKSQTYENIELIVSDDCSTDDTVEICRRWIAQNEERFVRTALLTVKINTGIAPNCNRGLYAAEGEWLKFIAGDDILLPTCIKEYMNYISANPSAKIVSAAIESFGKAVETKVYYPNIDFQKRTAKKQLQFLLREGCAVQGSSVFINKDTLTTLKGFNEEFPFFEDHPFFVKATMNNYKIYGLNILCVKYRRHENSILRNSAEKFSKDYYLYMKNIAYPLLSKEKLYFQYWHQKINYFLLERKNIFPYNNIVFRYIIVVICDPYRYYIKIKQFMNRNNGSVE